MKAYEFIKQLKQLPFVESVILYGSRARGDHAKYSDIDLAVNCPLASERDWQQILDIIDQADTLLEIDCVRYDQLLDTSRLKQNIDQEGVRL